VLQLLPTDCRTLALAMDASTLGQRFTILNLRVVICGSAIPVAWKVVPATAKGAWRPHWEGLFAHLRAVTPADWTVIVLADRGVSARWLFRTITAMGWRPFLRINRQGQYRPAGATDDQPLTQVVSKVWSGLERTSHVFHNPRTPGGRHRAGALGPRLYRTQVDPDRLAAQPGRGHVVWHARLDRGGSKDAKRGGWHWEQTKMTDPQRAERLWLTMALATLWVVSVGCAAEVAHPASQLEALPATHIARRRASGRRAPRVTSCCRRRRLVLLTALLHGDGDSLPVMQLVPEPWTKRLDTPTGCRTESRPHQDAVVQKLYT